MPRLVSTTPVRPSPRLCLSAPAGPHRTAHTPAFWPFFSPPRGNAAAQRRAGRDRGAPHGPAGRHIRPAIVVLAGSCAATYDGDCEKGVKAATTPPPLVLPFFSPGWNPRCDTLPQTNPIFATPSPGYPTITSFKVQEHPYRHE